MHGSKHEHASAFLSRAYTPSGDCSVIFGVEPFARLSSSAAKQNMFSPPFESGPNWKSSFAKIGLVLLTCLALHIIAPEL